MKSINLIPAPRRDAKRRRKHRMICGATCGAYGVLLACAVGMAHLVLSSSSESLDKRLAATDSEIQRFQRQETELRNELATARSTIEANRTVAEQPDWSIVLALLAKTIGEDVVLRSVSIAPPLNAAAPAPGANAAGARSTPQQPDVVLEVLGIGRTPLAVSQHVLRLEQTGLFSKVALLDTGREAYLGGNAIAFRLQGTFGEPSQPKPAVSSSAAAADVGGITR